MSEPGLCLTEGQLDVDSLMDDFDEWDGGGCN